MDSWSFQLWVASLWVTMVTSHPPPPHCRHVSAALERKPWATAGCTCQQTKQNQCFYIENVNKAIRTQQLGDNFHSGVEAEGRQLTINNGCDTFKCLCIQSVGSCSVFFGVNTANRFDFLLVCGLLNWDMSASHLQGSWQSWQSG